MLTRLDQLTRRALGARSPWTNAYGLARSVLAMGTALTLLVNDTTILFHPLLGLGVPPKCESVAQASLFCQLPGALEVARWIAFAILALVASGWRPRITGVLHWWIAWSLAVSGSVVDGGDQIAAVLTLLLVPITLLDDRRWHWAEPSGAAADSRVHARLIAMSAAVAIRVQVAGIYFHAAVGKFSVPQWADGTAVYYVAIDPQIGQGAWIAPLFSQPWAVVAATWGTLLLETVLFSALFMDRRWRHPLLVVGLVFHGAIIFMHGLFSFFFTMSAALLLYLHPVEEPWPFVRRAWRRVTPTRVARVLPVVALLALAMSALGCSESDDVRSDHPRCAALQDAAASIVSHGEALGISVALRSAEGSCTFTAGAAGPGGEPFPEPAVFRVGSLTKPFVGLTVEQLAEEGRLDLDAALEPATLGLDLRPGTTARQLANHTSGLSDYANAPAFRQAAATSPGRLWTPLELLELASVEGEQAEPGSAYRYSSTGYIVLGRIVEEVTGMPVRQVLADRQFEARGLVDTALATSPADPPVVGGWEWVEPDTHWRDVSGLVHPSGTWAAGGVVSTADDLATFIDELAPGHEPGWTDVAVDTDHPRYPQYRQGLLARQTAAGRCWGHDGRLPGYAGLAMYCPDEDFTLVLLANRNVTDLDRAFDALVAALRSNAP